MAENSAIEWTHHTFNPWIGCQRVSEGCRNCYAETLMDKRYGKVKWGPQGQGLRTSEANWRQPLKWNRQAKEQGRRTRVFCASLADVFEFHPGLAVIRHDLWTLIEATPNLDWLLLTKRPENVIGMVPFAWQTKWPAHVWLGTSVEDQKTADKRIPELLKIPAAVRFLSCEPLLGHVDLRHVHHEGLVEIDSLTGDHGVSRPLQGRSDARIHWVIAGGESGPGARPCHPNWIRSLRDQCQATGSAYFFKQWGEYAPPDEIAHAGWDDVVMGERGVTIFPNGKTVTGCGSGCVLERAESLWRVGKKAAGRRLDGREWSVFPDDMNELYGIYPPLPDLQNGRYPFKAKYGPATGETEVNGG